MINFTQGFQDIGGEMGRGGGSIVENLGIHFGGNVA